MNNIVHLNILFIKNKYLYFYKTQAYTIFGERFLKQRSTFLMWVVIWLWLL